jgi:hypothetical protein
MRLIPGSTVQEANMVRRTSIAAAAWGVAGVLAGRGVDAAPPPFTVESLAKTGQVVPGVGAINGPLVFFPPNQGGRGTVRISINESGGWLLLIDTPQTVPDTDEALLKSPTGLTPWIAEGVSGFLTAPTADYVATRFHAQSLNADGDAALALGLAPDEFSFDQPTSGVLFNRGRVVFLQGQAATVPGLAPGATWDAVDASTRVDLTDSRRLLVVTRVIEGGISRRAAVVFTLDATGLVVSSRLVAKEGGPVGAGPATWTTIAPGAHASAINEGGTVVFSGLTSAGVSGVYKADASGSGAFVATTGGPSPVLGVAWGQLLGAPLHINTSGDVVYRAPLADGSGVYTEGADAGEVVDTEDRTFGNGPLTRISGTLTDELDVDLYRITVSDASVFSATTVPDPGSGFAGAAFDTVLTLIAEPGNGTRARSRSDDAAPGVVQSTLTNLNAVSGRSFYLAVSTPRARPVARVSNFSTSSTPRLACWTADPADVTVSGGVAYWPDPSRGVIGRLSTSGGSQPDAPAPTITEHVAVHAPSGKVYWIERGVGGAGGGPKLRRANLDGSSPEDLVTVTAFGDIGINDSSGLAIDAVNGKVYWSRSIYGEINRIDLDGSNRVRIIQDYPPTSASTPAPATTGTFAPGRLTIDPAGGKVYWINGFLDRIERADLSGANRQTLAVGAGAVDLAVHAGKVYWTSEADGRIRRANLDGTGAEDLLIAPGASGLDIDAASATVYWTSPVDRAIRRAPLSTLTGELVATVAGETGTQAPDGAGAGGTFDSWARSGSGGGGPLAYQVRLTGATFQYPSVAIAKNSTKVAATGDVLAGIAPNRITRLSSPTGPLKISDRGDVLWAGAFHAPTVFTNFIFDGLFFNQEKLLESHQVVPSVDQRVINLVLTPDAIDVSRDGRFAGVLVNMQDPPYNFTPQRDNALRLEFTLPPLCRADFNGSGGATIDDIFIFLNAWFASDIRTDYDNSGTVTIDDIFIFLNVWFAGC